MRNQSKTRKFDQKFRKMEQEVLKGRMRYQKEGLSDEKLKALYFEMLKARLIEEKMLIYLRQGKISKWFSGIGQEAIAVGVTMALEQDEYILPMHRNLGVFTTRKVPLERLFAQWAGKPNGFTKGRDRSFHFGTQQYHIVGMISHLGPQNGVADGIALAHKLRGEQKVTAVFTGEGGTSEGDWHEAMNIAATWQLPVIFCIENNGYGLSTPTKEQYNVEDLADRGKGYGMEAHIIDGNNIVQVYRKVAALAAEMRKDPKPVLLEFKTFRRRGHEEASGIKYVPEALQAYWAARDPIENYRDYLLEEGVLTQEEDKTFQKSYKSKISKNFKKVEQEESVSSTEEKELADVFQQWEYKDIQPIGKEKDIRFIDAISEALSESMERHENLVIMGQDIAEYGGAFKVTDGFVEQFGRERVRNTPICESGVVNAAMGLSINGMKAVMEMQFGDFVTMGFNAIVNYLAKNYYRWGENADVVVRMPCGAGTGAGPFHSQTNEAWFTKTPGLKVVYPAFPYDAKGLLNTAINDPNPVIYFEHKALYRSIRQEVPVDYYTLPFGQAVKLREGEKVSIISFGAGVHWALDTLDKYPDLSADLIDLRTLEPLDTKTIFESVRKTGKAIILQEDSIFGGVGSDIAALIVENCFESLDGPVKRVGSLSTPIPFAKSLEAIYLAKARFEEALLDLVSY